MRAAAMALIQVVPELVHDSFGHALHSLKCRAEIVEADDAIIPAVDPIYIADAAAAVRAHVGPDAVVVDPPADGVVEVGGLQGIETPMRGGPRPVQVDRLPERNGLAGVQMKVDAGLGHRIDYRRLGKGAGKRIPYRITWIVGEPLHHVYLQKEVWSQRMRAQRCQIDIDHTVAVGVKPAHLP